ncbi:MAG: hypothetical protein LBL57_00090 [Tannerella sp.]|jgi:hypothetical protein|nr:hypothetical protein [Tannerella sp.]
MKRKKAESVAQKRTKTNTKKKAMIAALESSLGVVSLACEATGVSRTQHYKWLNTDESYKKQVESIADIALDFAESRLHERIKSGDTASIIFYLKTKGKNRGYTEKSEIEASANVTVRKGIAIDDFINMHFREGED